MKSFSNSIFKLFVLLIFLLSSITIFSQTNSMSTTGTPIAASPYYKIFGGSNAGATGQVSSFALNPAIGLDGGSVNINGGNGYYGFYHQGGHITLTPGTGASTTPGNIILNTPGASSIILGKINVSSAGAMSSITNLTATGIITANSFVGSGSGLTSAAGWTMNGSNTYSNGNVGIGLNPETKLDVNGDAFFGSGHISKAFIRGNSSFSTATTPDYTWWGNDQTGLFHPAADIIGFSIGGTENMRITGSGIGIGTSNLQGYKLAVNGGIICEEIKVITDVLASDYVFEEGYKPATLEEVEEFVKIHKHLPGIPSADEFKKNGYSVGKMDNMLLKQVEEMMLHLIDLEKENKRLSAEIETIKNK